MKYERILRLVKWFDLLDNNLSGLIPRDIESLKGLIILNVSRILFSSEILKSLENLVQLQLLGLSRNELFRIFPIALQNLTYELLWCVSW